MGGAQPIIAFAARESGEVDIVQIPEIKGTVLVEMPLDQGIGTFECLPLQPMRDQRFKLPDRFAMVFTLHHPLQPADDPSSADLIGCAEDFQYKRTPYQGCIGFIFPTHRAVAVGKGDLFFFVYRYPRLPFAWNDPHMRKKIAKEKVVIPFQIDDLDRTGETVENIDRFGVESMSRFDGTEKKIEYVSHQNKLRGFNLPFFKGTEKVQKRGTPRGAVGIGYEDRPGAESIRGHTR